jgi:TolA-binding protein
MGWMSSEQAELEFSNELAGALGELRATTSSCPKPQLLQAAQAGVLAPEQAEPITRHLEGCRFCKSLLSDMEELDNLELDKATQERIRDRVQQGVQPQTASARRASFSWSWWLRPLPVAAMAAVTVVLAIGLVFLLKRQPSSTVAQSHQTPKAPAAPSVFALEKAPVMLPASAVVVWRGQEDASGKQARELKQALGPYEAGDYLEAANRLEVLRHKYPRMAEAAFYLGVCRLFLNKNEEAAVVLKDAVNLAGPSLSDQATWYLALAYYRTGKPDLAGAVLEPVCKVGRKDSSRSCAGVKELAERH